MRRASQLLAAYLAFFLGLAPVVHLAHLVSGEHGHAYCAEHRQIEDVPRDTLPASAPSRVTPARAQAPFPSAEGAPGRAAEAHAACLILNGCALQAPLLASAQTSVVVLADRGADSERPQQGSFALCPLLLAAPKTSPPFVAA